MDPRIAAGKAANARRCRTAKRRFQAPADPGWLLRGREIYQEHHGAHESRGNKASRDKASDNSAPAVLPRNPHASRGTLRTALCTWAAAAERAIEQRNTARAARARPVICRPPSTTLHHAHSTLQTRLPRTHTIPRLPPFLARTGPARRSLPRARMALTKPSSPDRSFLFLSSSSRVRLRFDF